MPNIVNLAILSALAVALALYNIWTCAARSTIPLRFDARITAREVRAEKHPGSDDVFLWTLDDGRRLQIDRPIYEASRVGQIIGKLAWANELTMDGKVLQLEYSTDFNGMMVAMPLVFGVVAVAALWALRLRR